MENRILDRGQLYHEGRGNHEDLMRSLQNHFSHFMFFMHFMVNLNRTQAFTGVERVRIHRRMEKISLICGKVFAKKIRLAPQ